MAGTKGPPRPRPQPKPRPKKGKLKMETKLYFLGKEVKDEITGFKGIVLAENHKLSGEKQLSVQSKELKKGIPAEAVWLHPARTHLLKADTALIIMKHNIKLGEKTTDTITGLEGVATEMTFWLYECIRVEIQPIKLKDGAPQKEIWFDEAQLEPTARKKSKVIKPPGGPTRMDSPDAKTNENC
jgi:hypothetical protein